MRPKKKAGDQMTFNSKNSRRDNRHETSALRNNKTWKVFCAFFFTTLFAAGMILSVSAASSSAQTGESIVSESGAEQTSAQILQEFAENLDTLYGKSFKGFLLKPGSEAYKESRGCDYSDIPTGNAASCIYDYDQDGEPELLTVSINEDYTLTLTMFEIGEDNTVQPSASFITVTEYYENPFPVYAVEQGNGMTDVFLYEDQGPVICIDSVGEGLTATGRRHAILALTYDGTAFAQYADPFFDTSSGELYGEPADNMCRSLESFGTESLTLEDLKEICLYKTPFMEYLHGVREIYRADAVKTFEDDEMYEWESSGTEDRFEVTSIYFKDQNELYDHKAVERFPAFLSGNSHKRLPFCEELFFNGTLRWETVFSGAGPDGNLFTIEYTYLQFDQESRETGFETGFSELTRYFWVTEEKIYMVYGLTEEEKKLLLEEGTLPERAELVCSPEDMPDSLEPGQAGPHRIIETDPEGFVRYQSYNIPSENLEARGCLTLIWKKGEGLVGYQSKRTPAGADCLQVWNPEYVERNNADLVMKSAAEN